MIFTDVFQTFQKKSIRAREGSFGSLTSQNKGDPEPTPVARANRTTLGGTAIPIAEKLFEEASTGNITLHSKSRFQWTLRRIFHFSCQGKLVRGNRGREALYFNFT
jgi:hypothetical protein